MDTIYVRARTVRMQYECMHNIIRILYFTIIILLEYAHILCYESFIIHNIMHTKLVVLLITSRST